MESLKRSYVAFFDVDKTILSINSGSALVREAYRNGLMSTSDLINAIYLSVLHKFDLRDPVLLVSGMGKWLRGVKVDKMDQLAESIVNKHLIRHIRPEILSEIQFHRKNNGEIVILSSVMIQIGRLLGSHLGADNLICTVMQEKDGFFTGMPEDNFCIGDEKKVRLLRYCEAGNYNLKDAYYYGDSFSDYNALDAVGNPVCVKPDNKLAPIAIREGWRII
jgi:HAD superfamily hydrolase (TIGR01490 family)